MFQPHSDGQDRLKYATKIMKQKKKKLSNVKTVGSQSIRHAKGII